MKMLQLIYLLTASAFWFVKGLFPIDGTLKLTRVLKNTLCVVFIAKINHYVECTALHQLVLIILQLTNQIKWKLSAKSCGARAIFFHCCVDEAVFLQTTFLKWNTIHNDLHLRILAMISKSKFCFVIGSANTFCKKQARRVRGSNKAKV